MLTEINCFKRSEPSCSIGASPCIWLEKKLKELSLHDSALTGLSRECVSTVDKYCGVAFISYSYPSVLFDDVKI